MHDPRSGIAAARCLRAACLAAAGLLAAGVTAGCQGEPQLGQGGSAVTGSTGSAGTQGASSNLERCDRPLGTAALVEPDANALGLLNSVGLQSPIPLLRLMMAQSNCFEVVDRGAALRNIQMEQGLAGSGMLQQGSTTARGRMITTQYLITPNVVFSNPNAGGANAGAAIGSLFGRGGALFGGLAGSIRIKEAQTVLFMTDAQTGRQSGAAEGSAKVQDFGGAAGLGGWGGGVAGIAGISGYGNTAEGKLIAAAFLDAHNKLVHQVRATHTNLPTVLPTAQAEPGNVELVTAVQSELKRRGYYTAAVDGIYGRGTNAAIATYQRENNLQIDGQPSTTLLAHLRGSR